MNHIDGFRAEIQGVYTSGVLAPGTEEVILSPTGHFRLATANYNVPKTLGNYELTKAEIFDHITGEVLFSFLSNDETLFYSWTEAGGREYLICAEDIYGGQTIIDLTRRTLAGYSPGEDGFIWTHHYLSPDGKVLATLGCYWACPAVIKLYDFMHPMELPLPELREIDLVGNDEIILGWIDATSFKTKGIRREREWDDETMSMKTIREIPVNRIIHIDGYFEEQLL